MAAADMDWAPSPSPTSDTSYDCSRDHTRSVEALVLLAVVAMLFLHILGSLRRQSSHSLLHAILMGVYTLSYPLVSYTIGRMQSSDWYFNDFAVWAVLLLLLLGSTDSLTALRLDDIRNWKSTYVQHLFKGFLVVFIVLSIGHEQQKNHEDMRDLWWPVLALLLVGFLKWYVRMASMRMASKSYLCKNMKVIAEYMQHKENPDNQHYDAVTMEGYRYMVAGENSCVRKRSGCTPWCKEDIPNVTTVEQIWQCKGKLLQDGHTIKDVCLSMALSKMLNRRFADFKLCEAGLLKTRDFVFKGLLAGGDAQRAFRVIEQELVFVHDLYYTRYSYLYQKGRYWGLCLPVIMCALCSWLTVCLFLKHEEGFLLGSTVFITAVVAFLEAYQLYLYIASGWFKVALVQSYVSTPSLQQSGCFLQMVIGLLLRFKAFRPWNDRLGQYCILGDKKLGRKSGARNCPHYATLRLVDKASKKGRQKSVELSDKMKKTIVEYLLKKLNLTDDGVTLTSLKQNGVHVHDDLQPLARDATATDDGKVTRTIVIWHIATTLCLQELDAKDKQGNEIEIASTLSNYCMHLVAFAPNLLPDHWSISESILDQSIEEASRLLKGVKTLEERCDKLMHDGAVKADKSGLVARGVRLARHLNEQIGEPKKRLEVLSEFWTEMMLYISPSDDAQAHLETLARGGEFITHLWALLTHAGVLKRGPIEPTDIV